MHIWDQLQTPITILAPMEDVTDTVFRHIIMQTGRPTLFFTEFTNVDGLLSPLGAEKVGQRLKFTPDERPLIAQLWGTDPEKFREAAKIIAKLNFDGIDINMGCPVKDVVKQGAGGGCIGNQKLAAEILQATREGAGDLPVSIKTRLGKKTIQTEEWIGFLLKQDLPALTVHLRTVAEQSAVPAHWEEMEKIMKLRNEIAPQTKIIGNGDIMNMDEIKEKVAQYGCDGIMLGRGIFHNPWLFSDTHKPNGVIPSEVEGSSIHELDSGQAGMTKNVHDRLTLLKIHVQLFDATWQGNKPYQVLKKYFKIYLSGFDGASKLREQFMETTTSEEAINLVNTLSH